MTPSIVANQGLASSELSLWSLFWNAHWIVQGVMLGLLICSVWVWAIAIDKTFLFARMRRAMDRFEQAFWSGQSLEELYKTLSAKPTHSMAALFVAAMREWKRSLESQARSFTGLQMRIEKVMDVTIAREVERLERRLLVLATVGSAGPFVGLFGTVWGIMTSFQSIAAKGNTSLQVVAPGHCRSAVRNRNRPRSRHTGDDFLQQVFVRGEQAGAAPGGVRRRVFRHPVAADR